MVWLLTLALLAAAPDEAVAESQRLLEAGDFDAALRRLEAGLKADPTPRQRGQLHLDRARCLSALRRNAEIEGAMEAALEADPTLRLEEGAASPGFRATLERVRARLAGSVTIETEPTGAAVRIDGAMVGRSPVTQLLPVGRYTIGVLDAAGNEAVTREVLVTARRQQTLMLQLPTVAAVERPAPPPPVARAPADAEPKGWPVELAVAGRTATDFRGIAVEAGVALLGRYFVVELDVVLGNSPGAGLRAGGRFSFARGLLGVQLTADAVGFFRPAFAPGGGATLSFGVHPLSFLDVLLDGGFRVLKAAPGYRSQYLLAGLTLRLRWPQGLDAP